MSTIILSDVICSTPLCWTTKAQRSQRTIYKPVFHIVLLKINIEPTSNIKRQIKNRHHKITKEWKHENMVWTFRAFWISCFRDSFFIDSVLCSLSICPLSSVLWRSGLWLLLTSYCILPTGESVLSLSAIAASSSSLDGMASNTSSPSMNMAGIGASLWCS